jgi:hypothetical protein
VRLAEHVLLLDEGLDSAMQVFVHGVLLSSGGSVSDATPAD